MIIDGVGIIAVIFIHILDDVPVHLVDELEPQLEVLDQLMLDAGDEFMHIGSFKVLNVIHVIRILHIVISQPVIISFGVKVLGVGGRTIPAVWYREVHVSIFIQVVPIPVHGRAAQYIAGVVFGGPDGLVVAAERSSQGCFPVAEQVVNQPDSRRKRFEFDDFLVRGLNGIKGRHLIELDFGIVVVLVVQRLEQDVGVLRGQGGIHELRPDVIPVVHGGP